MINKPDRADRRKKDTFGQAIQELNFEHALQELKIERDAREEKDFPTRKPLAPESDAAVRFAREIDFPDLIKMWKTCFNESDDAAKLIFAWLQKPENILVIFDGGKPAAMLSFAEFSLTSPMKSHKAAYIYGVATLPEHQKKGYSTELLNNAHKLFLHRGMVCSVLVPAGEKLFDFYKQRGYETAFNINKVTIEADELTYGATQTLQPLTAEKFAMIRDSRFSDSKMFACWSAEYLEYIIMESNFYGGGAYYCVCDGKQICAACQSDGETVYITELGATNSTVEQALRSIAAHFEAKRYVLYLREDVQISYTNNLLPFAMVKWYDNIVKSEMSGGDGGSAYIAHTLK